MSSSTPSPSPTPTPPTARKYAFYRSDFGPLEARPLHLDLYFDMIEDRVVVTNHTTFIYTPTAGLTSSATLTHLTLNSTGLEVASVDRITDFLPLLPIPSSTPPDFPGHVASFASPTSLKHELDSDRCLLHVTLDSPVLPGQQLVLRLVTIARPTAHVLEGIYYDYTPPGCPRTMITQCQQCVTHFTHQHTPNLSHPTVAHCSSARHSSPLLSPPLPWSGTASSASLRAWTT